jgi:hypothetical protein
VRNGHCEGFVNCVLMGANNDPSGGLGASGEHVIGIDGPPSGNSATLNTVQISGNYPTNSGFVIERIRKHGDTNAAILDNINIVKLSDNFVALYSYAGIAQEPFAARCLRRLRLPIRTWRGSAPCRGVPAHISSARHTVALCRRFVPAAIRARPQASVACK